MCKVLGEVLGTTGMFNGEKYRMTWLEDSTLALDTSKGRLRKRQRKSEHRTACTRRQNEIIELKKI